MHILFLPGFIHKLFKYVEQSLALYHAALTAVELPSADEASPGGPSLRHKGNISVTNQILT